MKISVFKEIKTEEATCDWCKEPKKCFIASTECVDMKGHLYSIKQEDLSYEPIAVLRVGKHYKSGFLSNPKYIVPESDKEWRYVAKDTVSPEFHRVSGNTTWTPTICSDCVKQLAKG